MWQVAPPRARVFAMRGPGGVGMVQGNDSVRCGQLNRWLNGRGPGCQEWQPPRRR